MKIGTLFTFVFLMLVAQGSAQVWTQKANLTGAGRYHALGFSIGSKGYLGTGNISGSGTSFVQDFWEYDQASDSWTQKAGYPGQAMYLGVGFSIGNKGYAGLGYENSSSNSGLMYEYDPITNTWTQKASMPAGRNASSAFTIGTKGYIVGGVIVGFNNSATDELWEFDPIANTWTQRASFPAGPRARGNAFSINGKGYFGLGHDASSMVSNHNEFYQYDASTNAWTQKASFPDSRRTASGFVIGNSGFIGGGYTTAYTSTFYEYNTLTDTWTQRPDFPPLPERWGGTGFGIGNKGYMGLGRDVNNVTRAEWYEYAPLDPKSNSIEELVFDNFTIYPNPSADEATISLEKIQDISVNVFSNIGQLVMSVKLSGNNQYTLDISELSKGIYYVCVEGEQRMMKKMIKL